MSEDVVVESLGAAERLRTVEYLKRKARSARLQAARSAPVLSGQLKALAMLIEVEAEQLENADMSIDITDEHLEHA
jgi:hypothetical protein